VRLDDIADAERIDVDAKSAGEAAGNAFAAELGNGVRVHGVYIVGFVEGKGSVVKVALAEADFVGGFTACDDNLLDAELACCFDNVIGAGYVAAVAFVVLEESVQDW
jgi:hypothetical protein